ncbi:hypothetical protein ILYODFUR_023539 [Ilyodon furcidens]|uniref:Secreted protein n=1 Tax=Ilyodon furcidens TaxID=33524 RepID=A0ABV0ULE3_9TELE
MSFTLSYSRSSVFLSLIWHLMYCVNVGRRLRRSSSSGRGRDVGLHAKQNYTPKLPQEVIRLHAHNKQLQDLGTELLLYVDICPVTPPLIHKHRQPSFFLLTALCHTPACAHEFEPLQGNH